MPALPPRCRADTLASRGDRCPLSSSAARWCSARRCVSPPPEPGLVRPPPPPLPPSNCTCVGVRPAGGVTRARRVELSALPPSLVLRRSWTPCAPGTNTTTNHSRRQQRFHRRRRGREPDLCRCRRGAHNAAMRSAATALVPGKRGDRGTGEGISDLLADAVTACGSGGGGGVGRGGGGGGPGIGPAARRHCDPACSRCWTRAVIASCSSCTGPPELGARRACCRRSSTSTAAVIDTGKV